LQGESASMPSRFVWLPNKRQPQHDLMLATDRLQNSELASEFRPRLRGEKNEDWIPAKTVDGRRRDRD